MTKSPPLQSRRGLSLLIAICAFTCLLLVFNSAFIVAFYEGLSQSFSQLDDSPKLKQAILFASPLVLLIIEWKIYDLVISIVQRRKSNPSGNKQ
ncbi:MAG: hypothetical protein HOA14_15130 [Planctomycetaceae bacterium]|nr:hypothetical protein [Planctomycetaceae bacterium]MBT5883160.1 hypothetical protein [Planctomycetaceae bacterium]MBT6848747.1 hypothetical protein [Planctomycetaceae bacterium]